ncbi:hypothetical protein CC2G_002266 [Coprinopsis cinerea AmutBmut pab1-1]|nr:hypothetical protein CC2G_002266 [Coprinopsis cinerea AmutBmut pab1-1]
MADQLIQWNSNTRGFFVTRELEVSCCPIVEKSSKIGNNTIRSGIRRKNYNSFPGLCPSVKGFSCEYWSTVHEFLLINCPQGCSLSRHVFCPSSERINVRPMDPYPIGEVNSRTSDSITVWEKNNTWSCRSLILRWSLPPGRMTGNLAGIGTRQVRIRSPKFREILIGSNGSRFKGLSSVLKTSSMWRMYYSDALLRHVTYFVMANYGHPRTWEEESALMNLERRAMGSVFLIQGTPGPASLL